MMRGIAQTCQYTRKAKAKLTEKKPGPKEPGLRYWPREADTITFQEGLLNFRATGGGGQMRNANDQRAVIMVSASVLQQPSRSHVRHAQSGRPPLLFAHHETAKHLHPRHRLQLFGIDEIGVELDRIGLAE